MRILIASDAWFPQINGVVRTLSDLTAELRHRGIEVLVLSPQNFSTVPCPTYPEIRLALARRERVRDIIASFRPDLIHIATEGPIGLQVRRLAIESGRSFTTSFHTRFPEYLRKRAPIPPRLTYAFLRWFHAPATACLVPSNAIRGELARRGFSNLVTWTRGVDQELFQPKTPLELGLPRPIFMTVSRVAPEKNLEAFLDLDLPGSKLVVGDGPSLPDLKRRYRQAHFAGVQTGEMLARYYSTGDVFVFSSKSDTCGVVLIEALACGLPIAAYPEPGPLDVVAGSQSGCLSDDLRQACLDALDVASETALARAADFGWEACTDAFLQAATRHRRDVWPLGGIAAAA